MGYQIKGKITCVVCKGANAISRGLCRPCYNRARKAGTLSNYSVITQEQSFLGRINKTPTCWLWTGTKNGYGYGIFLLPGEVQVRAHRYSYEHFKGPIADGLVVMHSCDNPPCVNPDHLSLGTKADNNRDTAQKCRHNYGTDHWNGKLTEAQVKTIKSSPKTTRQLADHYGVNYSTVHRIRSGNRRRVR
jgi:hypothetical protein